ncbi:MAG: carboxyl transferase domain-containing protein, partial [Candidatus Binatia bacterium]
MSWEKELEELARRRARALEMGGAERIERQHAAGKLTVRERIERLVDAGSFEEVGTLTGRGKYEKGELVDFHPANFVFGT